MDKQECGIIHRHGFLRPAFRAAAVLLLPGIMLVLGGCGLRDYDGGILPPGDAPQIAGNSFDSVQLLGEAWPDAERVIISYNYGPVADRKYRISGVPLWLYAERGEVAPRNFAVLGLTESTPDALSETIMLDTAAVADLPGNDVMRLLVTRAHCFDTPAALRRAKDADIRAYAAAIRRAGYSLSGAVYVQQYLGPMHPDGGARFAAASIQDIGRDGQNCGMLGDLARATEPAAQSPLARARRRAERTFDFSG